MGVILSTKQVTKRFGGLVAVNSFEIDVYNNSSSISDLKVVVFVNNKLKLINTL